MLTLLQICPHYPPEMRSAVILVVLLGTMCFAWEESGDFMDSYIPSLSVADPGIPDHIRDEAWDKAKEIYKENVFQAFRNGTGASKARRSTKTTPLADEFSENSNIFEIYADILSTKHKISKRQASGTQNPAQCTNPATNCGSFTNSRYRTVDGTCNNINSPVLGATNRPQNRLLQQAYEDNFNAPRGGFNSRLPNPRVVSVTVHPDNTNAVNRRITNMVPQFGQFIDHDMTLTPEATSQCCANPNSNPANCWPIAVGQDAFFRQFTQCLDFTRSTPCIRSGIREQMNMQTAYIDGSQIYGADTQRANVLRTFQGGMLRTNNNLQGFLPLASSLGIQSQGDFVAGDNRINEMPGLIVMHNVWIMEHNRIASAFQRISGWNDERIYQETRRIVTAEVQQVTYNEYLPTILGQSAIREYQLAVGTWSTYNPSVDATIVTEFSTAAYRFGHSLISGLVQLFNANNQVVDSFQVANEYFQSRQVTRENGQGYDMLLRGLMKQNSPEMDRFVTTGVTNFLFKPQNSNFGSDLVARNIQRGRDHGLRSYNDYRVACGGSDISNQPWGTAPPNVTSDGWAQASRVYARPADIDLFVGGLIEIPIPDGLSGPTFTCLKALQFARTKFGDRYFFTHNQNTGFTSAQLNDITRRRLGDIICDNSQQPNTQANVFLVDNPTTNPTIQCGSARPSINLNNYL